MSRFRGVGRHREATALQAESVLVIGLGRFGGALAETLEELGTEVLAVDSDPERVQDYAERLSSVRQADTTSATVLRQLGAPDFEVAVVAIGSDIESSILTTAALADVGVPNIWAKAIRADHGRILERVGAHHVVYPERQMGIRTAHAVSGRVIDYFELDPGFVLAEVRPPRKLLGKTLLEADIRSRYGVTVVCVKPAGSGFTYATPDTRMNEGDILVVAGEADATEAFAGLQ
jgi:trk system potassium uptake protein